MALVDGRLVDWSRVILRGLFLSLIDLTIKRIERLHPDEKTILSYAAIIGREFDLSTLQKLIGDISSEELLIRLDETIEQGLIEENKAKNKFLSAIPHTIVQPLLC